MAQHWHEKMVWANGKGKLVEIRKETRGMESDPVYVKVQILFKGKYPTDRSVYIDRDGNRYVHINRDIIDLKSFEDDPDYSVQIWW